LLYHLYRNIENNGGLLTVRSTTVNFSTMLKVSTGKKQSNRCCKLTLSLLFRDFNIGGVVFTVAIWLYPTENIADDLLLPIDKLKALTVLFTLGVLECIYKGGRMGSLARIKIRVFPLSANDNLLLFSICAAKKEACKSSLSGCYYRFYPCQSLIISQASSP
jgi:hypothetical protein